MMRKLKYSTLIFAILISLGLVQIKAVGTQQEYSDNVARYVLKSNASTNLINKTTIVKPKTSWNLDYKVGSKYTNATYTSSNTAVATVNKTNGVVYFKKVGTVTINVAGSDGRKYKTIFKVGDTFVIVNISKQTAKLYVNSKLVRTAKVVTGMAGKTPTPKGTFKIAYKQRDTYLDGSTVGYDYYLAVKYWVPLANTGGVGLHDASWRSYSSFGGSFYKYDGSHGCINMRTKDIAYFYKYIKAGTTVKII